MEAVLAIEDVRFNKDNSIVSIKKNEEKEVLLSSPDNGYGENNWKKCVGYFETVCLKGRKTLWQAMILLLAVL